MIQQPYFECDFNTYITLTKFESGSKMLNYTF